MIIDNAIALAVRAHAGQKDQGGEPYMLHVLRVAMKFSGADDLFAIAVLHDAIEDTKGDRDLLFMQIRRDCGEEIAVAVNCLTRLRREPYLEKYIPRVASHPLSKLVKIADLEDNLDPRRLLAASKNKGSAWVGEHVVKYLKALEILKG